MALVQKLQAQGRIPVVVFRLQDRIHLANFRELEEAAKEAYSNGARDVVIDSSQTAALTSIGVRAIIIIHKLLAQNAGKHLKLACP
jgi:anti-anti-sigma regulatory factor